MYKQSLFCGFILKEAERKKGGFKIIKNCSRNIYVANIQETGSRNIYVANIQETGSRNIYVANVQETGSRNIYVASIQETGSRNIYVANSTTTGSRNIYVANVQETGSRNLQVANVLNNETQVKTTEKERRLKPAATKACGYGENATKTNRSVLTNSFNSIPSYFKKEGGIRRRLFK